MKTIQELYNEVVASEELKAQFIEAANIGKQEEFLKAHGCEATLEEVKAFLDAKQNEDAPLSLDELENAAGGKCDVDLIVSLAGVGVGCVAMTIASGSAQVAGTGYVGKKEEGDNKMCNLNAFK